jgi:DNA-binding MarR family transcriptional regulator
MNRILARSGTTFPQWVALTKVAADGGTADRRQLIDAMTGALKIDDAAAAEALAGLAAADLLEALEALPGTGSRVGLTPPGQARYREIRAAVDRVTARLYGDIPPAELATAGRVLALITARANELAGE